MACQLSSTNPKSVHAAVILRNVDTSLSNSKPFLCISNDPHSITTIKMPSPQNWITRAVLDYGSIRAETAGYGNNGARFRERAIISIRRLMACYAIVSEASNAINGLYAGFRFAE